jgi:hypothetical protein
MISVFSLRHGIDIANVPEESTDSFFRAEESFSALNAEVAYFSETSVRHSVIALGSADLISKQVS